MAELSVERSIERSIERSVELSRAFKELDRLACPVCHQKLRAGDNAVICTGCSRRYPVVDGIPVLLANRAN
jgi:uncharacterized protein YbaR (Trm112 family)